MILRHAGYVVLALALLSWLGLRRVDARVDEVLLGVGARTLAYPGAPVDEARHLELNGVLVTLRTQEVQAPVPRVLEHYRQRCAEWGRGSSPTLNLLQELSTKSTVGPDVGYVACVDVDAANVDALAHKLGRFAQSWDLSDLGGARYVYAHRSAERPTSTFLLTMWVNGPFDLRKMLPVAGRDADGADLAEFPRPPNAQRLISVRETSKPSTVVTYLSRGLAPRQVLNEYRAKLPARGWALLERSPGESLRIDGARLLAARKSGRLVSVVVRRADEGNAMVTLLETRSR